MVAEAMLLNGLSKPLTRIGLPDQFIECGSTGFLQEKYGLRTEDILAAVRAGVSVEGAPVQNALA